MAALLRLSQYPHARLRIACHVCGREGRYSVARLAERHGAEVALIDLLRLLTAGCKWQRGPADPLPRPYEPRCLARFPDLCGPTPSGGALKVIEGGRG